MLAVAHSMLVMASHMLQRQEPSREAGADDFDQRRPEDTVKRLVTRLERLGYRVTLQQPSMSTTTERQQLFSRQAP